MAHVNNEDIKSLNVQKQIVCRQEASGEISKKEYEQRIIELDKQIKELDNNYIKNEINSRQEKEEEQERRNIKMVDEIKKEKATKVKAVTRGPKKDSYASLILETLQKKSIKNVDAATDVVMEKKPGRDRAKVKAQIVVMINEVKKGKKPAYTWDETNFQLNLKA